MRCPSSRAQATSCRNPKSFATAIRGVPAMMAHAQSIAGRLTENTNVRILLGTMRASLKTGLTSSIPSLWRTASPNSTDDFVVRGIRSVSVTHGAGGFGMVCARTTRLVSDSTTLATSSVPVNEARAAADWSASRALSKTSGITGCCVFCNARYRPLLTE